MKSKILSLILFTIFSTGISKAESVNEVLNEETKEREKEKIENFILKIETAQKKQILKVMKIKKDSGYI